MSAQNLEDVERWPGFKFGYYAILQFVLGPCQRSRPYTGMNLWEHVACDIEPLLILFGEAEHVQVWNCINVG